MKQDNTTVILPKLSPMQTQYTEQEIKAILAGGGVNYTSCAKLAGYSGKRVATVASRLHRDDNIRAYIDAKLAQASKLSHLTIQDVVNGLKDMAFPSGDRNVLDRDRLTALQMLGKYLGMFDERVDITVRAQSEYSAHERAEAKRISALLVDQSTRLIEQDSPQSTNLLPTSDTSSAEIVDPGASYESDYSEYNNNTDKIGKIDNMGNDEAAQAGGVDPPSCRGSE